MQHGYAIYSPVTQGRIMASFSRLPSDYSFWKEMSRALLKPLDEFIIYTQAGWTKSTGLIDELSYAVLLKKPIKYVRLRERKFEWVSPDAS
jgi:hypothetical protein